MNSKRPKVEPIRNPTLFEMEKLQLVANLTTDLKIERPYSLPGTGIQIGTSAFTAAGWGGQTRTAAPQNGFRAKGKLKREIPVYKRCWLNDLPASSCTNALQSLAWPWEHTTICVACQVSLLVACGVGEKHYRVHVVPVLKRKMKEVL